MRSLLLRGQQFLHGNAFVYEPDVQAYITAVQIADQQALELGVKTAINDFVVGCKADGIWDAIKASSILAGAHTLTGALVPLKGTAPTNFNFIDGDYNRTTGLLGDGSTKYLNSNRNVNADPQDSSHQAVWISVAQTNTNSQAYIGAGAVGTGSTQINYALSTTAFEFRNRVNSPPIATGSISAVGLMAHSRNGATSVVARVGGTTTASSEASQVPHNGDALVFARNSATNVAGLWCNARLAFYSIGESLDLALLDARVTTLISNYTFALNTGLNPLDYDANTIAYVNAGYAAGGTLA